MAGMTDIIQINPGNPEVVVVGSGQGGAVGPAGPTGPAGKDGKDGVSGGFFTYTQSAPATVWTINHNLGYRPQVTVVDSANSVVEGDRVYTDANNLVLTFSAPFSGVAYLS
jgi:hypothetical protein